MKVIVFRPSSLAMFNSGHWHTGAASVVKVLLWENQPFTAIDGAPQKHENNASSWPPRPAGYLRRSAGHQPPGFPGTDNLRPLPYNLWDRWWVLKKSIFLKIAKIWGIENL
jgi:hypothetical protein